MYSLYAHLSEVLVSEGSVVHKGEQIIPAGENRSGPVFNVDMRGASVEAVQRLESLVQRVNGSIESRAVRAVFVDLDGFK